MVDPLKVVVPSMRGAQEESDTGVVSGGGTAKGPFKGLCKVLVGWRWEAKVET